MGTLSQTVADLFHKAKEQAMAERATLGELLERLDDLQEKTPA